MEFEWDPLKAASNVKKHHVGFEEALTAFMDPFALSIHDPIHSEAENRFILVGLIIRQRYVAIAYTMRGETVRIISVRLATQKERRDYEAISG